MNGDNYTLYERTWREIPAEYRPKFGEVCVVKALVSNRGLSEHQPGWEVLVAGGNKADNVKAGRFWDMRMACLFASMLGRLREPYEYASAVEEEMDGE